MKVTGNAMMGVGFPATWQLQLSYNCSGSGDYAFSVVKGNQAKSWPVLKMEIPFQVGQENAATELFVKLEQFIKDNLPEPEIHIGLKQEGTA